jgi:hypothetical protein
VPTTAVAARSMPTTTTGLTSASVASRIVSTIDRSPHDKIVYIA